MTQSQPVVPPTSPSPLRPVLIVLGVLVVVIGVSAFNKYHVAPEKVHWLDNFNAARETARAEHKPILLYFTASWCGPCQEMRRRVWTDARVADALSDFVTVRIDVDRNPQLARTYHVEAIPMFFVMDEDANIQHARDGAMEAAEFVQWVNGVAR